MEHLTLCRLMITFENNFDSDQAHLDLLKLFDTLIVFLQDFSKKLNLKKKNEQKTKKLE